MRPDSEYRQALELIEAGVNDCEIERRLGIPRSTIRRWRVSPRGPRKGTCFRCNDTYVDEEAYAYLLGAYLGDGYIATMPRTYQLRVSCDLKYEDIINEIASCMVIVRSSEKVGFGLNVGCVDVMSCWNHWVCAFPQHGPGRKHERAIQLEPWQQAIVEDHPKELIRGLIHSDGNRHINPVTRRFQSGTKKYFYPRYMFTNASDDIRGIFTDALNQLGVQWTKTMPRVVSIARREDVAFLDTFVGPKR